MKSALVVSSLVFVVATAVVWGAWFVALPVVWGAWFVALAWRLHKARRAVSRRLGL